MKDESETKSVTIAWIASPVCIGLGAFFAFAIGGGVFSGVAVWPVVLAFVIQWLAFIPAFLLRTEKFYDLVGGLSFISVAALGLVLAPERGVKELLLFGFVAIWASRLSLFLFVRVHRAKTDRRFDQIKHSFPRFLFAWTAQGLWVTFSLAPVIAVMFSQHSPFESPFFWFGVFVWLFGFSFEVIADRQKSKFKKKPENKGAFIQSGLWSLTRHPNYFGEIVLWCGVSLIALPSLSGWQFLCLLSPVFIYLLLRFVSGVPMLERSADERWGEQEAYRNYKDKTPVLFPKFPVSS